MNLTQSLLRAWYAPRLTPLALLLTPLAAVFIVLAGVRRRLYRSGVLRAQRLAVPVVVVGNLTVGGTGKTPLVIGLAQALAGRGWHPGVVTRGYGRSARGGDPAAARVVGADDDPAQVGDESLLIARRGIPVAVGSRRAAAARALCAAESPCDVIIADDGLQHYGLARDVEIVVVDGTRGFGNGWRLPAGPLRESVRRLREVDAIVMTTSGTTIARPAGVAPEDAFEQRLVGETFFGVGTRELERRSPAAAFRGADVHAVAGIGNPERFFETLRALGLAPVCHAFPDHHRFVPEDLAFSSARAILMTEKDALKCRTFADRRCWYLPVAAVLDPRLVERVVARLETARARATDTGAIA